MRLWFHILRTEKTDSHLRLSNLVGIMNLSTARSAYGKKSARSRMLSMLVVGMVWMKEQRHGCMSYLLSRSLLLFVQHHLQMHGYDKIRAGKRSRFKSTAQSVDVCAFARLWCKYCEKQGAQYERSWWYRKWHVRASISSGSTAVQGSWKLSDEEGVHPCWNQAKL